MFTAREKDSIRTSVKCAVEQTRTRRIKYINGKTDVELPPDQEKKRTLKSRTKQKVLIFF